VSPFGGLKRSDIYASTENDRFSGEPASELIACRMRQTDVFVDPSHDELVEPPVAAASPIRAIGDPKVRVHGTDPSHRRKERRSRRISRSERVPHVEPMRSKPKEGLRSEGDLVALTGKPPVQCRSAREITDLGSGDPSAPGLGAGRQDRDVVAGLRKCAGKFVEIPLAAPTDFGPRGDVR
jgi:hypothetical protein